MKNKHTMSVSGTISAGLFFLLALLVLFIVFINTGLYSNYNEQVQRSRILTSLQKIKTSVMGAMDSLSSYLDSGSIYKLSDYYVYVEQAEGSISGLAEIQVYGEETIYTLSSMEISLDSFEAECETALTYYNRGQAEMYENVSQAELIADYLSDYADELLALIIAADVDKLSHELSSYKQTLFASLFFVAVFFLFIIFIIYLFRSRIQHPLSHLAVQAENLSAGDFSARSELSSADRAVALLSDTLNQMADDIKRMMEDLKGKVDAEEKLLEERRKNLEYEAMLDKATFLVLQTQTNPHFLYNTLNTISRTITLGQYQNSQKMLSSLSHLMRYNLSSGDVPAILREEIEITEEYLSIQSLRFGERVKYIISIPDELLDTITLPRFTLQPLVENSIIHGIEPLEKGGTIVIDAKKRGKSVILRIADNGQGFDTSLHIPEDGKTHIGIENTRKRVEMFFHSENAFRIISRPGRGTMIIITTGAEE